MKGYLLNSLKKRKGLPYHIAGAGLALGLCGFISGAMNVAKYVATRAALSGATCEIAQSHKEDLEARTERFPSNVIGPLAGEYGSQTAAEQYVKNICD